MTAPSELHELHQLFWISQETPPPETAVNWRRRLEMGIRTVMEARGLPRSEAEEEAYRGLIIERLNDTHPNTDPNRCAYCGELETPNATLLPIGGGLRHAWLHRDCWEPWRDRRRAEAVDWFAVIGIAAP